jgi:subtilase family serine protease
VPQVDNAYGIDSLFQQTLEGSGQTVVIVDAFGSDTIQSDADSRCGRHLGDLDH